MLDGPLHGLDRVLEVDEDFTHPFRLAALVCLRQCIRNVATLLYLTVRSRNQLSNVLILFRQSGQLLSRRFAPAGLAHAFFQSSRLSASRGSS